MLQPVVQAVATVGVEAIDDRSSKDLRGVVSAEEGNRGLVRERNTIVVDDQDAVGRGVHQMAIAFHRYQRV
jgi:hypothetical protein